MRSADPLWIVYAGVRMPVSLQRRHAIVSFVQQIVARTEAEAIRRTGFDACRFETDRNSICAKRALVDFLGRGIQLWNIKRTTRHAIAATDACVRIKVHDSVD